VRDKENEEETESGIEKWRANEKRPEKARLHVLLVLAKDVTKSVPKRMSILGILCTLLAQKANDKQTSKDRQGFGSRQKD
jgi:hypothetical protein